MNIGLEVLKENSIDIFDKNIDVVSLVIDICQTSNELELELMHCHEMLIVHSYVKQYGVTESLNTLYDFSFEGIGKVISDVIAVIKEKLKKLGELLVKAYNWVKEKILKIKSKKQVKSDKYTVHYNPNDVVEYVDKIDDFFNMSRKDVTYSVDGELVPDTEELDKMDKRIDDLSKIPFLHKSSDAIIISSSKHDECCNKIEKVLKILESFIKTDCQHNTDWLNDLIKDLDYNRVAKGAYRDKLLSAYSRVISMTQKLATKAVECVNKLTVIYNDYNNISSDNSDTGFKSKYGNFPKIVKGIEEKNEIHIRTGILSIMDDDKESNDPISLKVAMEVDDYLKKHKILDEPLFDQESGTINNLPSITEADNNVYRKVIALLQTNFSIEKIKYFCDVIKHLNKKS